MVVHGATPAALGLLADVSERYPTDRGAIMGLYSVFLAIGQIIGAVIGGAAADIGGIDAMFVATLILLGIALVYNMVRAWQGRDRGKLVYTRTAADKDAPVILEL